MCGVVWGFFFWGGGGGWINIFPLTAVCFSPVDPKALFVNKKFGKQNVVSCHVGDLGDVMSGVPLVHLPLEKKTRKVLIVMDNYCRGFNINCLLVLIICGYLNRKKTI